MPYLKKHQRRNTLAHEKHLPHTSQRPPKRIIQPLPLLPPLTQHAPPLRIPRQRVPKHGRVAVVVVVALLGPVVGIAVLRVGFLGRLLAPRAL